MSLAPSNRVRRQLGLSLFSMLFWAIVVGGGALVLMKVYPSLQKYLTTRETLNRVMRTDPRPASIPEIRRLFEKQRAVEYVGDMIRGNDLEIEAAADGFKVSFSYDDEVELVDPVFLLIKYRYTAGAR